MSTKKGKAVPLDREIPDGTAVISVVHPEGNPKGVTVEETVVKDNTSDPRPNIGTNVGEALEQALQSRDPKPSTKTKTNNKKEQMKMEETTANKTTTNTETTTATEAKPQQPKAKQKPKAAPATPAQPKAEQQPAAAVPEENPQQFGDMIAELKTLKGELATSTRVEVEHFRRTDNTGRECGHQFLVGLATGAGVALGVTIVSTAAWLIQRKLSGNGESPAE